MLAEILSRMERLSSEEVSPRGTLPDPSHTLAPGTELPPPGCKEALPCPTLTSECSGGYPRPPSKLLLCSL